MPQCLSPQFDTRSPACVETLLDPKKQFCELLLNNEDDFMNATLTPSASPVDVVSTSKLLSPFASFYNHHHHNHNQSNINNNILQSQNSILQSSNNSTNNHSSQSHHHRKSENHDDNQDYVYLEFCVPEKHSHNHSASASPPSSGMDFYFEHQDEATARLLRLTPPHNGTAYLFIHSAILLYLNICHY